MSSRSLPVAYTWHPPSLSVVFPKSSPVSPQSSLEHGRQETAPFKVSAIFQQVLGSSMVAVINKVWEGRT